MKMPSSFLKTVVDLIGKDDLSEAIKHLYMLLKDSPHLDEAILQSARYNNVVRQIRLGLIDYESANITHNQIRTGLLELVRDIELMQEQPAIKTELEAHTEKKITASEYDNFLFDIRQYLHNQSSTTSMPLIGKTVETLEKKSINKLLTQKRVKTHFNIHKIKKEEQLPQKLKSLNLMTNGYVLKGTFLCLAGIDQIRSVSNNAHISKFFVFEDMKGFRTGITEFISGNLIEQFHQMLNHIKRNLYLLRDIDTRTEDFEIPESVFTELLANAFIHRSYEPEVITDIKVELYPDRMEITNPGRFSDLIDLQDLANNSKSFIINPEIVQTFYLHDLVETAAKGISRSQELLKLQRLQPAKFEQKNGYVKVVIFKTKKPLLSNRLETAFQFIEAKNMNSFFDFMEKEIGQQEILKDLRMEFIKNGADSAFLERLRVLVSSMLR
jgi:predicted HTH transcriptional regulator